MAKTLTAADIKGKVARMLKAYGRKLNDKDVPHYYNNDTANMAIGEAKAWLEQPGYEITPRTKKAIENWCDKIRYY